MEAQQFMIRHWVKFEGKAYGRDNSVPRVTIGPQKAMILNQAAFAMLGSPEAVELYFDSSLKRIGVKRTKPSRSHGFEVKEKKGTKLRTIYAGAFCNHFGLEIEKTVQFHDLKLDPDGILELDMTTATNIKRGAR
jgi:hypothetical protein